MPAQTIIKLRRGTAAQWTSANPVLEAGEIGLETDTRKLKYGNGSSTWSALSYGAAIADWADITSKPATFAPSSHTHVIADVTSLQTSLDAKAPIASPTFTGTVTLPANTSIGTVSLTEIGYLDGVTSAVQTQIDSKAPTASPTFTGTVVLPATTSIGPVSNTEIGYLDGVSSAIQTQLNGKEATITGGASTITSANLTASRALTSNASGKVAVSTVTDTELGHLSGVTSAIQTQINGKANTAHTHIIGDTSGLQTALDAKAPLAGPTFTGTVVLPATTSIGTVSDTEIGYLDGVSSAIQTQLNGKQATITGGATTITSTDLTAARVLVSGGLGLPEQGKVTASSVTSTELGYLSGVSSAIQTQLNGKQATITGGASTIVSADLALGMALASNSLGKVIASSTTSTELGYLSGVTSAIQTQINGKAASVHTHAISDVTSLQTSLDGKLSATVSSPTPGQVITYNGTAWVNGSAAAGGITLEDVTSPFLLMGA